MEVEIISDRDIETVDDTGGAISIDSPSMIQEDQDNDYDVSASVTMNTTINEAEEPSSSVITEATKEKYYIWKKNAPYLYDYLQTSALTWPSLTVQWFPDVETNPVQNTRTYRLLSGTFTSGNAEESLKLSSLTTKKLENLASLDKYDPDTKEFMATDADRSMFQKLNNTLDIHHQGEINKARYMPQKPDLIATINNTGNVYVFDRTKHSSVKTLDQNPFKPQIRLKYHQCEGFGISWNVQKEGHLLSAALDGHVALWDLLSFDSKTKELSPQNTFSQLHEGGANDVKWLPKHDSIFGSVGEDKGLKISDIRKPHNSVVSENYGGHDAGINSLSFNHDSLFCVATGDSSGNILVWDLRNLNRPEYTIKHAHNGSITVVDWNPNQTKILASGGQDDNSVKLWDLGQIGNNKGVDLAKDNNPDELLFVHGGHMLGVNDLSWNPNDDWLVSSVANDNSLHIWMPSSTITRKSTEK
ncbi:Msi1 protein [Saccharomycopsis crataegensis]|uniref:Msi1 protein n=1 Tax=Saccharomycopsis crataegensis TaxID=43959 RepID=A0AAV5QSU2_9ASCO|nr:Msi1 protein [Saccharomycopsis crataegensis]